jgi:rhodanese-related sulfurtransferase
MSEDSLEASVAHVEEEHVAVAEAGSGNPQAVLQEARDRAKAEGLAYAGGVPPQQAYCLIASGAATLLDVRSGEERTFVGHVPQGLHVAWATGTALTRNPRFAREVEAKVKDKNTVLLLLCRSGKRSAAAAEVLRKAGYVNAFNVLEGFEGEIDTQEHRGGIGGWRFHGLPWKQN